MAIQNLDHIGIAVPSIADALPFYQAGLGLEPSPVEEVDGMGVRVTKLGVGGSKLELIEPVDPDGVIARFLDKRGAGIHHICLQVDDVEAATEQLRAQGYEPVFESPRDGADGMRVNFLRPAQTGGVLIELAQHA